MSAPSSEFVELAVDEPRRVRPAIARAAGAGGDQVGVGRRQQQDRRRWSRLSHPPLLPHAVGGMRTSVVEVSAMFAAGTPHPSLRGVVLRYEGYADRSACPVTFRQLPCTFVPIIIDLDAGWTVAHREHTSDRAAAARFVRRRHHRWAGPGRPRRVGALSAGRPDAARRPPADRYADERAGQPDGAHRRRVRPVRRRTRAARRGRRRTGLRDSH